MKLLNSLTIFLIISLFVVTNGKGQSKVNFIELNLTYAQPQGFFGRNLPKDKVGFEIGYLRQLKSEKPLFWGISVYYNQLGSASAFIQELVDFQLLDFDYRTASHLLGFNGKVRFYPNVYLGKLEWYLEAQLGYKWLYTYTTKTLSEDTESSDSNIEKGSLSLTYGASTGINYPVGEQTYINVRINYLPGLSVPYYVINENNEIFESSLDQFDLKRSTTDIIRWDLGVTYRF